MDFCAFCSVNDGLDELFSPVWGDQSSYHRAKLDAHMLPLKWDKK